MKQYVLLFVVGLTGACTGMTSQPYTANTPHVGLVYSPPTTELPLSIAATKKGLAVTAGALEYVRDENYTFQLSHVTSPFHASTIKLEAPNGLLKTVNLESDGRPDEAIV